MADDLGRLTTTTLREDLAKHRRYRISLTARHGQVAYDLRTAALVAELYRRGVPDDAADTAPVTKACRLHPLGDHVVVLPTQAKDVTEGGIIIPENAKEVPVQGELLAVGPGRVEPGIGTVLPAVAVGQTVLFGRYSGAEFVLDGLTVLLMREEDLLGILAPEAS